MFAVVCVENLFAYAIYILLDVLFTSSHNYAINIRSHACGQCEFHAFGARSVCLKIKFKLFEVVAGGAALLQPLPLHRRASRVRLVFMCGMAFGSSLNLYVGKYA